MRRCRLFPTKTFYGKKYTKFKDEKMTSPPMKASGLLLRPSPRIRSLRFVRNTGNVNRSTADVFRRRRSPQNFLLAQTSALQDCESTNDQPPQKCFGVPSSVFDKRPVQCNKSTSPDGLRLHPQLEPTLALATPFRESVSWSTISLFGLAPLPPTRV